LLRICEVLVDQNLPPFWQLFPNLQKKELFSALDMAVTNRANQDDSSHRAPAITPEIIERISSFRFGAHDVDDLTGGLSPFLMVSGTPDEQAAARERSCVYTMVQAGNAAPTLDQLTHLVSNAPRVPKTLLQLLSTYGAYGTLLEVILGINHRVSQLFRSFLKQWTIVQTEVKVAVTASHLVGMLPLFLRHTQSQMSLYFSAATLEGAASPPPRLMGLIEIVRERNWRILPELPLRYMIQQGPSPATSVLAAVREAPAAASTGGGGRSLTALVANTTADLDP
jgi:hypothetical protein